MARVIARVKGKRYRVFDEDRAKMGPWQRVPEPSRAWLNGAEDRLREMTVPELRSHARWLGLTPTTRTLKATLVEACAVRTYFRQYRVGELAW